MTRPTPNLYGPFMHFRDKCRADDLLELEDRVLMSAVGVAHALGRMKDIEHKGVAYRRLHYSAEGLAIFMEMQHGTGDFMLWVLAGGEVSTWLGSYGGVIGDRAPLDRIERIYNQLGEQTLPPQPLVEQQPWPRPTARP